MKKLETNDWLVLNNIIYKIHTTTECDVMRKNLLEQLRMVISFDSADFYLSNPTGREGLFFPVAYNCENVTAAAFDSFDYSRGIMYSGKAMVYRETDIISDEKRIETEYYNNVYKPNSWHYSLQMILGYKKEFVGVITFYRTIGKMDFEYDDIFKLDMIKDHLSYRIHSELKYSKEIENKYTVTKASNEYNLTKREELVLGFLMQGLDNQAICDQITISNNTLKKHILNLYKKLGIKNRVQLFKMIREHDQKE